MMPKIPPHSIDTEQSVLAGLMFEPKIRDDVFSLLKPEDFYRSAHNMIFDVARRQYQNESPTDLVSLSEALKDVGLLEQVGGAAYLARLLDEVPVPVNVEYYCRIIRDKALLRSMLEKSNKIAESCMTGGDACEIIDNAQQEILGIDVHDKKHTVHSMRDLVVDSGDRYDWVASRRGQTTGVPSGFADLDYLTCGFQPSDLIILAARPSMGKTALALNIARHTGRKFIPTLFFSLEMSKEQLHDRLIASVSGVNSMKFRAGNFTQENWEAISRAKSDALNWPLHIVDTPGLSYAEVRSIARRQYKKNETRLIIIDYMQLMSGDKSNGRTEEISSISRQMKHMAKELNVPVIVLSQLNRKLEDRPDKRPILSDLRESGAIEQDADIVMMLFREEVYNKNNPSLEGLAELDIKKQRTGPTGKVDLRWDAKTTTFQNLMR